MGILDHLYNQTLATGIRYLSRVEIETHEDATLDVPSRDPGRTIKVNVYQPKDHKTPSPVLINFHGSGFIIPMHGSDDDFARLIASETAYTVLDASYRLAPEHPFPAATNDAADVLRYVFDHPELYDAAHISVSGFSAGGNLALGLAGEVYAGRFEHVIAFYPPTDLAKDPWSKAAPDSTGKAIPPFMANVFTNCYLPPGVDRAQPLASPIYIDAARYPKNFLMVTCDGDSLCEEAEEIVARVKGLSGRNVVHSRVEKCNHGFDKQWLASGFQEKARDETYALVVAMLSER